MAKSLKVILLEDVPEVGAAGDVVAVSEGYARNVLFPEGKAALATPEQERQVRQKQQQATAAVREAEAAAHEQAEQLEGTELALTAEVKDGDEIFGSITAAQIAKELSAQTSLTLKAKDVLLAEPITKLGSHDAMIRLRPDVEATIRVTVTPAAGSESEN